MMSVGEILLSFCVIGVKKWWWWKYRVYTIVFCFFFL